MEVLLTFLLIISWVIGLIMTFFSLLSLYYSFKYPNSLEEKIDMLNGFKMDYHKSFIRTGLVAFICWAFIIANYLN